MAKRTTLHTLSVKDEVTPALKNIREAGQTAERTLRMAGQAADQGMTGKGLDHVRKAADEAGAHVRTLRQQLEQAHRAMGQADGAKALAKFEVHAEQLTAELKQSEDAADKLRGSLVKMALTEGSVNDLENAFHRLRNEWKRERDPARQKELRAQMDKTQAKIREMSGTAKQEAGQMGRAFEGVGGSLQGFGQNMGGGQVGSLAGQAGSLLGGLMPGGALLGGAAVGAGALLYQADEAGMRRSQVATNTGLSVERAGDVSSMAAGIAAARGADFHELERAATALVRQTGGDYEQAFQTIRNGFAAGANANGDFLQQLHEYAPFIQQAGMAQQEAAELIARFNRSGGLGDKGMDAMKEMTLSLNEMGTAQMDALNNAFGPEFTNSMTARLRSGAMDGWDALQEIVAKSGNLNNEQIQLLFADILKGAGEDAGRNIFQIVSQVGGGIESLIDPSDRYNQAATRVERSQTELNQALLRLNDATGPLGVNLEVLANEAMAGATNALSDVIIGFEGLMESIGLAGVELPSLSEAIRNFVYSIPVVGQIAAAGRASRVQDMGTELRTAMETNDADAVARLYAEYRREAPEQTDRMFQQSELLTDLLQLGRANLANTDRGQYGANLDRRRSSATSRGNYEAGGGSRNSRTSSIRSLEAPTAETKHINISITKLIETLNISSVDGRIPAAEIRQQLEQLVLGAVNDAGVAMR